MRTERQLSRRFTGVQPLPTLEPLTLGIDQRDQRNRGFADLRRQCRDVVEHGLGRRIKQLKSEQSGEATTFIRRCRWMPWRLARPHSLTT